MNTLLNKYADVPVSKKTNSGMTFTIDDRAYLQRMFTLQDNVTEKFMIDAINLRDKELTAALAEVIQGQNDRLFAALEEHKCLIEGIQNSLSAINLRLDSIEKRLDDGDIRFALLEKYAGLPSTIIRIGIAVLIALGSAFFLHTLVSK